jgi:hypothetical protein
MSFDIGFFFSAVPPGFAQHIEASWAASGFPARLIVPANWRRGSWHVETPLGDDDPRSPGRSTGDEAMAVRIDPVLPNPAAATGADEIELARKVRYNASISVPMSNGVAAFLVASSLAGALKGVVYDPQLTLGDFIELARMRDDPERLALEERGFFVPDFLRTLAEKFWHDEREYYAKSLAMYETPAARKAGLFARLKASLLPPPAKTIRGHIVSVRAAFDIRAEAPLA